MIRQSSKGASLLAEVLSVGIVQTNVNAKLAWRSGALPMFTMARPFQERSWNQIRSAIRSFNDSDKAPNIIVFPELSIPRGRISDLTKLGQTVNAVVIAGIDYTVDLRQRTVRNEAIILVPNGWAQSTSLRSYRSKAFVIGKTFPASIEENQINKQKFRFNGESNVSVFYTDKFSNFGVCICYDLMDLERALMYRGQITHLFVLAYNKDVNSFYQLAEASARSIYCNVVICNSGYYGGSLVTTVKYAPQFRTVYRHEGAELFTSQIVELPVKDMWLAQNSELSDPISGKQLFKGLPPNYSPPHLLKDLT